VAKSKNKNKKGQQAPLNKTNAQKSAKKNGKKK